MTVVTVILGARSYDIVIERGLPARAADRLAPLARGGRLLCVTDTHVAAACLPALQASLASVDVTIDALVLPPGEGSKDWSTLARTTDWLLEREVERADHIIALGGGVIGDLTGFAANIVKRGCQFVQIPTSLLAQVDSSVGGKTAINSPRGKNLIGAFHQPALVLIDPDVLASLPPRELAAGWAEVVKYGVIDDAGFFDWCEANREAFFAGDHDARTEAIIRAVTAKARIVAADERETAGIRALLNLGHTFGHALEAETGFGDRLLHGEAVGAGMTLALRYSVRRGLCEAADADRLAVLLAESGLPVTLAAAGVDTDGAALVAHMAHDKKKAAGNLPFLLAHGIGRTFVAHDVDLADVAAFLDAERAAA